MKKKIFVLFIILLAIFTYLNGCWIHPLLISTQVYNSTNQNIKGNVDIDKYMEISEDFEIGANKYGYAVFKNPIKAMNTLKKEYKDGIRLIQTEFNLLPLSQLNYETYKTYGWQVSEGSIEERKEASFVSGFLDIYENSYKMP